MFDRALRAFRSAVPMVTKLCAAEVSEEQLRINIADICSLYTYGARGGLGRIGIYPFSHEWPRAQHLAGRGAARK